MKKFSEIMGAPGFPQRLENENGQGKVMEHAKLAKSHGILLSVMEFYQFCSQIARKMYVFVVKTEFHCQCYLGPAFTFFRSPRDG